MGGMVMSVWLPDSLYRLKPWTIIVIAIIIPPIFKEHLLAIIVSLILFGYGIFILIKRFMWKDSGLQDLEEFSQGKTKKKSF